MHMTQTTPTTPAEMIETLKAKIRHVPDFPKPGILFYDITTLLGDADGFRLAVDALVRPYRRDDVDLVVGVESRGFILGAAVADRLRAGFVPVRKVGKLPSKTIRVSYDLEYGSDSLEMHEDGVAQGARVLIVDDLLATGGTARATVDLVKKLGGSVHALAFLVELAVLNGRAKLPGREPPGRPEGPTERAARVLHTSRGRHRSARRRPLPGKLTAAHLRACSSVG